jgi:hypothetical protein
MTPTTREQILSLCDAGEPPGTIAASVQVSPGYVYSVLRSDRPGRPRVRRSCTSSIPDKVRALRAIGTKQARIAQLLGISRQYVSKISVDNPR